MPPPPPPWGKLLVLLLKEQQSPRSGVDFLADVQVTADSNQTPPPPLYP